jgi:hypothetical protein
MIGRILGGFVLILLASCQTTADYDNGKVYMTGKGIAKYHIYNGVSECKTAFGLDPDAFDGMVTAIPLKLHAKFPDMTKVGKRDGPYDPKARCIRVRSLGTGQAIVVRAIDKCCGSADFANPKTHQLDLAEEAFEKLAPLSKGNLSVEWALVDCPNSLQVKSDSAVCDDGFYFRR